MRFLLVLLVSLFVSCGAEKHEAKLAQKAPAELVASVSLKAQKYLSMLEDRQDADGFILTETCDAALFSGLLGALGPKLAKPVNIEAVRTGVQWFRRPSKDCGPTIGNSRSSVSRDMMIGILWSLYKQGKGNLASDLLTDLRTNAYMLRGEGTVGELFVLPSLANTIALIAGTNQFPDEAKFPVLFFPVSDGYTGHLLAWHILLRGAIQGAISSHELDCLKALYKLNPKNPLYVAAYHKYVDGDQTEALTLLADTAQWPADSLPTNANHCGEWPVQREPGKDWLPCSTPQQHTGAELPVILYLVILSQ